MTCPYENSEEKLKTRESEKESKYNWIKPSYLNQDGLEEIHVYAIAIGSCGTILRETMRTMTRLGLNATAALKIQKACMLSSADIVHHHLTHDDYQTVANSARMYSTNQQKQQAGATTKILEKNKATAKEVTVAPIFIPRTITI